MEKGILKEENIKLVIFDEAHRAVGKYSYTLIVDFLEKKDIAFRVLALSATPGNNSIQI